MSDDGSPLSLEGIKTAAAAGRLPALARRLVLERRWSSLDVLLTNVATPAVALEDAGPALLAVCEELAALPPADQREAFAELREIELSAAGAIVRRADRDPLTAPERGALAAAGALYFAAGELKRAAQLYERAGDDERAADIWGSLGELERMEACLTRQEKERAARRRVRESRQQFETLIAAGERQAAAALALSLGDVSARKGGVDERQMAELGRQLADRLCRGRSVALRVGGGRVLRVAEAPATLGRAPEIELPVRDPTVSRRHAVVRAAAGERGLVLEDAGSRGGTRLGGLPLAGAIPLRERGEIALGEACRVAFVAHTDGSLELAIDSGLDRGWWAVVSAGPVDLGRFVGLGPGLVHVGFAGGVARLERVPETPLRVAGNLIGQGCDLVHGDAIDGPGVHWEVI